MVPSLTAIQTIVSWVPYLTHSLPSNDPHRHDGHSRIWRETKVKILFRICASLCDSHCNLDFRRQLNIDILEGRVTFRDAFKEMLDSVETPFEECKELLKKSKLSSLRS